MITIVDILYLVITVSCLVPMTLQDNPVIRHCFSTQMQLSENCKFLSTSESTFVFGETAQNVLPITGKQGKLYLECVSQYPIRWLARRPQGSVTLSRVKSVYDHRTKEYSLNLEISLEASNFSRILRCEGTENTSLAAQIFLNSFDHFGTSSPVSFGFGGPTYFIADSPYKENEFLIPCAAHAFDGLPAMRLIRLGSQSKGLSMISPNCAICTCVATSECTNNTFPLTAYQADLMPTDDSQDCASNHRCATCAAIGPANSFRVKVFDCNRDGILSCEDYAWTHFSGDNDCRDEPSSQLSAFRKELASCLTEVKENFTIMGTKIKDYDPRIGFRLKELPDLHSMYQCSSSLLKNRAHYNMLPLSTRWKINATIHYRIKKGEAPLISCEPQGSVHNLDVNFGACDTISDCDLKFKDVYPYVTFIDARDSNDTSSGYRKTANGILLLENTAHGLVQCSALFRPYAEPNAFGYIHETDYLFTALDRQKYLLSSGVPTNGTILINPNVASEDQMVVDSFYTFTCEISTFVLTPQIHFEIHTSNGQNSSIIRMGENSIREVSRNSVAWAWELVIKVTSDVQAIACYAPMISSSGFARAEFRLSLKARSADDSYLSNTFKMYTIPGILLVSAIFLGMAITMFLLWRKYKTSAAELRNLTKEEIDEFYFGKKNLQGNTHEGGSVLDRLGFKDEMVISSTRLKTDELVLGSGAFGVVFMGSLDDQRVAVKTCKSNANTEYFKAFLKELKVMAFIEGHDNVVKFHGAVVDKIMERICYAVLELSPYGNLIIFLHKHAGHYDLELYSNVLKNNASARIDGEIANIEAHNVLRELPLISFCRQIAAGMEFISLKQVIHGDLAARNILVFPNNTVKVTDFGLSTKLYNYANYTKSKETPLPWRWMALESLRYSEFSTKSDVWSFGVTLWEIFSLGQVPFPGINWTPEFMNQIESGKRLRKPQHADEEIFNWMMTCWASKPENRPTFSHCTMFFRNLEHGIVPENETDYSIPVGTAIQL